MVSTRGLAPLSWTMDHAGPMTRTVRDASIMLNVMAGYDPGDPHSVDRPAQDFTKGLEGGVRGLRVGIPRNHFFDGAQPDVERAVRAAADVLAGLGAEMSEVDCDFSASEGFVLESPEGSPIPALRGIGGIWMTICGVESYTYHRQYLTDHREDYGEDTLRVIELAHALKLEAPAYVEAVLAREQLTIAFEHLLTDEVDLLLTPSTILTAPTIRSVEEQENGPNLAHNTWVFNLTSQPSISVPCGFDSAGLPIGLMLTGRKWSDPLVLRAGHAYEQATEWHKRSPELETAAVG